MIPKRNDHSFTAFSAIFLLALSMSPLGLSLLIEAKPAGTSPFFLSPGSSVEEISLLPLLRKIHQMANSETTQEAVRSMGKIVFKLQNSIPSESKMEEMEEIEKLSQNHLWLIKEAIQELAKDFPKDDVTKDYQSRLSHHLGTPLTQLGYIQLLDPSKDDEKRRKDIANILAGFRKFKTAFDALPHLNLETLEQFPRAEVSTIEAESYFISVTRSGTPLSRGREFPGQAKRILETGNILPLSRLSGYRLKPGSPEYTLLLGFLLTELRELPLDGQAGRIFLLRTDTADIVSKLISFITSKEAELTENPQARQNREDLKPILDLFPPHQLEIFKNEIYPEHGIEGIGYSLDMKITFDKDHEVVSLELVLERYSVTREDGFHVSTNGVLALNLTSGELVINLDETEIPNVHRPSGQPGEEPLQSL